MSVTDDQQFCLRWNNFQANITSQFEALRDDEDFTDVTIACEGQRLQAHKVVLSACSPFFKELFKSNPCPHPIIFMRDVEAQHIVSLMEFMYAGEVNVAQAHLSAFLKTAESLKIRGLTDTSSSTNSFKEKDEGTVFMNSKPSSSKALTNCAAKQRFKAQISSTSTVTSSQDLPVSSEKPSSPPPKRHCRKEPIETELSRFRDIACEESLVANHLVSHPDHKHNGGDISKSPIHPKTELPDYLSDDDRDEGVTFFNSPEASDLPDEVKSFELRKSGAWSPTESHITEYFGELSNHNAKYRDEAKDYTCNGPLKNKLVKLGEGIEIYEDQLRSVKWSDYRKLTRGLATILFSPAELATSSVTGQRWSRAGSGDRPVKPALNKAKVQAIISYVATRFPMVEISRIKQVLAYKCKENSTALKMKAIRYYSLRCIPAKMKVVLILVAFSVGAYAQTDPNNIHYFLWNSVTSRERLWTDNYGNNIDRNAEVKILLHGWTHDIDAFWYPLVVDSYVRTGNNVIAIDWASLAQLPYAVATDVERLDAYGINIARFIIGLSNLNGIPFNRIHLIGHSLGAHLAGFAGDNIQRITGSRIRRITGLDPAGMQFTLFPSRSRLSTDDADQVDTILTDAGPTGAGIFLSIGHVNFWPNGGIAIQPGCAYYPCSHNRACHYFNEGITSNRFVSRRCTTFVSFLAGLCLLNPQNIMGDNVNFSITGDFFLVTNPSSPFAVG